MGCNKIIRTLVVGLSLSVSLPVAQASAELIPVTVVQRVEMPAHPSHAVIVVSEGTEVIAIAPAAIVEQHGETDRAVVGRVSLPLQGGPFQALFMVYGKNGELFSTMRVLTDLRLEPAVLLDSPELKRRLTEQKIELKKWDVQMEEQRSRLKRIQEQADALANVERIVDADDELGVAKREEQALITSLELARTRQTALKGREKPPNFTRHEAELSAYLNALSTELKVLETRGDLGDASQEFRQKRDLIEATKYEHMDLLRDELDELRRKREALQKGSSRD